MKYLVFNVLAINLLLAMAFSGASAQIVAYPAPPGLITSPDFTVTADNREVWVERVGSKLAAFDYKLYGSRELEDLNVAGFCCSGKVTINIKANVNIDSLKIRPVNRNIKAIVKGSEITFDIDGPQKLYIEINNLPHLAVFADPPNSIEEEG